MPQRRYQVGIDVGLNSVGFAAIEVDDSDRPVSLLNLQTIIHDGGIDPSPNKTAGTRKAVSGTARRMRRLIRRRKARLADLDRTLRALGYPIIALESKADPRYPWRARFELVTQRVDDPYQLRELFSVAVRHMARHRGWRNPYRTVASLKHETEPSKEFRTLIDSVQARLGQPIDPHLTVAEIVHLGMKTSLNTKLRGKETKSRDGETRSALLASKVHQSDNVRELRRAWDVQGLPPEQFDTIVNAVFQARSPKGSAAARVGRDPLDGSQLRAEKASLAFQRYRLVSLVANLRAVNEGRELPLDAAERRRVVEYLWAAKDDVTWDDVAAQIGLTRRQLKGTARETDDGERASARPPVNVTDARIREARSKVKELVVWWEEAAETDREALIEILSNGAGSGAGEEAKDRVREFVSQLPEETMGKFDEIKLPEGRAAYSAKTLRRLTDHMLATTDDLHEARKAVFGVPDGWRPPADPIGLPVGNPAVDRVLKLVARWLAAAESQWGAPLSVNVEHTRDGLISEKQAREIDRANNQRFQRNLEMKGEIAQYLAQHRGTIAAGDDDSFDESSDGPMDHATSRDVNRWRALTRQDSRCLYCGVELVYPAFEMDHIVPRAGQGATNTQVNLAAVCRECNASKGKLPFAEWANSGMRPQVTLAGAVERARGLRFFGVEDRDRRYKQRFVREIVARLKQTHEDEPIDNRSIESVGWMANELHRRIRAHYHDELKTDTDVRVFRGWVTSEARKAAGINDKFLLIGGQPGKNRLDRRHHAVDAATIALLRPGAARVLVVRDNLRKENWINPAASEDWKKYCGADTQLFETWKEHMEAMVALVSDHLAADHVPVFELLRLRLGSSKGHEDTIRPTVKVRLGNALSTDLIDRSATPQQWVALRRAPEFNLIDGLPADDERMIRVKNQHLGPNDIVEFFPPNSYPGMAPGYLRVRGGCVELGSAFHHGRIYRCEKRLKSGRSKVFFSMLRVYQVDLLEHRNRSVDLFAVELPPQSISVRSSESRLRNSLTAGEAQYIGWIVPGDELLLDMSSQTSGKSGAVVTAYPDAASRWCVTGLSQPTKLSLSPRALAGEGLPDDAAPEVRAVLTSTGWVVSIDVLFGKCHPTIIRRDILGRPRLESTAHLPTSWTSRPSADQRGDEQRMAWTTGGSST